MLLKQTKCAKLNRCTPLDRVMFESCLFVLCLQVLLCFYVVLLGGSLLDNGDRPMSLLVALRGFLVPKLWFFGDTIVRAFSQI